MQKQINENFLAKINPMYELSNALRVLCPCSFIETYLVSIEFKVTFHCSSFFSVCLYFIINNKIVDLPKWRQCVKYCANHSRHQSEIQIMFTFEMAKMLSSYQINTKAHGTTFPVPNVFSLFSDEVEDSGQNKKLICFLWLMCHLNRC